MILFWFKDEDSGWYLILIKIIIYIFQYSPLTSRQKKQIDVGCSSRHMYVAQPGRAICCPLWHWPITKPKHPEREIYIYFELGLGLSPKKQGLNIWAETKHNYAKVWGLECAKLALLPKMQYFVSDFCAQNLAYSYVSLYLVVHLSESVYKKSATLSSCWSSVHIVRCMDGVHALTPCRGRAKRSQGHIHTLWTHLYSADTLRFE